jgi:hypothetical protein
MSPSFEIETNASNFVVGAFLTQHGHLVSYHSETQSNAIHKCPTYDKEMYFVVQGYHQ